MLKLSFAPYRLLFREPFGTAHGFRDGTDCVYVKLERNGTVGFGEATMPPYVNEDQDSVIDALRGFDVSQLENGDLHKLNDLGPCARAAITTAYFSLIANEERITIGELLQLPSMRSSQAIAVITLGLCPIDEIPSKLDQLPKFNGLKIKLDGTDDKDRIRSILEHDTRRLLIDANQAWSKVDQALELIGMIDPDRLIGLEQPFPVDRPELQRELANLTTTAIYADESIQDLQDLDNAGDFSGVNLKLMKCGGLDHAIELAEKAKGMKIMLGSMSESSIGCAAMLRLSPIADVIDLDGPWLIKNDPFSGLQLQDGQLVGGSIRQLDPCQLNWNPIGA